MKPVTLAVCCVAVLVVLALFVYFTPGEGVADQPVVNSPDPSRSAPEVAARLPDVQAPTEDVTDRTTIDRTVPERTATDHAQSDDAQADRAESDPAFTFMGLNYHRRSSESNEHIDLHEFTPTGQGDLSAWTDMVSVIRYRDVNDEEGLAVAAELMYAMYESMGGKVLVASAIPDADGRPGEYLLVGLLFDPNFIEAVFNRLILHEGTGMCIMVARREYGRQVGDQMSEWLRSSGEFTQNQLLDWNLMDVLSASR